MHAAAFQFFQAFENFGHGQPELRAVTAGRLPAAGAAGGQLHAHADFGSHADFFSIFQNQTQLGVFFDHRNDVAADFVGQHGRFDELGIFEAVADDRRIVARPSPPRPSNSGLLPASKTKLERLAEFQHFFHHLPLLVHLDRIHAAIIALILLLGDRGLEHAVDFGQPVLQNIGEANQDRQIDAAQLQPIDQLLQIDRALGILRGMNADVPLVD